MSMEFIDPFKLDLDAYRSLRRSSFYRSVGKRAFDVLLAIALFPFFAFIILIVSPFVLSDGGSLFFAHTRVGRDGRTFRALKLRTMMPDAQERLEDTLANDPERRAEWQATFKLADDPRINPVGKILRKLRLDELPQIWNVLTGEMSWVGPRPVTTEELSRYGGARAIYESVRPGASGPWQISDQHDMAYDERVSLDIDYVHRMSFLVDIACVAATLTTILKCSGK